MAKLPDPFGLPINPTEPQLMHVDMNSCFATIEQQANPLLRGRPMGIAPYDSPRAIIIAPSIEAKAHGIKLGTRVFEAQQICPDFVALTPDPNKYRDAHLRFKRIFMSYTDKVVPKSIDEAVIDFRGSQILKRKSMEEIGYEIKQRVYEEIGEWVRINVGIGTNRFLAKTAAGLNKPDGLDTITKDNILDVYRDMELTDITGINVRYEARLNANGIFSPLQFFAADLTHLKKRVFKSIVGYHWYVRLRGWEIDDVEFGRKSFGHTYALGKQTADKRELSKLLMKLCEKTGRRLRNNNYYAGGIYISVVYVNGKFWHKSRKINGRLYTTQEIFLHAIRVLNQHPNYDKVRNLAVSVYDLNPHKPQQSSIFDGTKEDKNCLTDALDDINDKYGEFTITPALMMAMDNTILDRVAFGGTKEVLDLYQ